MISIIQNVCLYVFQRVEAGLNLVFDDEWNPLYHLGALSFFFFWIIGATGVYLFIFFETSIFGAYNSIELLTNEQWYLGGVMRSLHRYASDALALSVTLHLFREFALGRFTGARWFSWFSGIPLLWLMFAAAIGGYWLVWDQFAQYVAVVTMEWLDWLPSFGDPMARNFLTNDAVSDRFFSLMVFLHIGIPLFMMLAMFIHISRVTKAKSNPPKGLAIGTLLALTVLSLIKPAVSAGPADLSYTQQNIPMDWFYLNIYPLIDDLGAGAVWFFLVGLSTLLSLLPWLKKTKKEAVAVVDPDHCSGCGWCDLDCPFGAIDFTIHPTVKGHRVAVVDDDRCTACGICSGSCPAATPFQHVDELKSGIGIPSFSIDQLKQQTLEKLARLSGDDRLMVFGCDKGAELNKIEQKNTAVISLPCIGFLPPSFVDYILRKSLADGVMVTGCCLEDCYYRTGNKWVEQRFEGARYPHLRAKNSPAKDNIQVRWAGGMELKALSNEVQLFQQTLAQKQSLNISHKLKRIPRKFFGKGKRYAGQAVVYAAVMLMIGYLSTSPSYTRVSEGFATVKLSLRHSSQLLGECQFLTDDALQRLPPNMRQAKVCPRERSEIEFEFLMDGESIYHQTIQPAGINNDGRAKLYSRFEIPAGAHRITARLKDHRDLDDFNYQESRNINLAEGKILVVDFDPKTKRFIFIGAEPGSTEADL